MRKKITYGIALIIIGAFFLAKNLGFISVGFFSIWWPIIPIVIGVSLIIAR